MTPPLSSQARLVISDMLNLLLTKGWTQGAMARTAGGWRCSATYPEAQSYCLAGALTAVRPDRADTATEVTQALKHRINKPHVSLMWWNDELSRTKEEVVALLKGVLEDSPS